MPLQATSGAASQDAFGGNGVAVVPTYIEDVFSTFLWTGNDTTQTITNGIDLSTKGGLVWTKTRTGAYNHILSDTSGGTGKFLSSNTTDARGTDAQDITAFNTTGFTVGNNSRINNSSFKYASWTFRKQPKFFDIVTYTGSTSGGSSQTIAHNLGSVPGCIIVKATSIAGEYWAVWHRSFTTNQVIYLNLTNAVATTPAGNSFPTLPTSTNFTVGFNGSQNGNGTSYVAYLFAHDAGGFGLTGTDNVISCGSWTGTGTSSGPIITLGYEPQWVVWKAASSGTESWHIRDVMRGMPVTASGKDLYADSSSAEGSTTNEGLIPTATGLQVIGTNTNANANGVTYIYIAIRRGPMKVPTTGTSVFSPLTSSASTGTALTTGFPLDLQIAKYRASASGPVVTDRLRGVNSTSSTPLVPTLLTTSSSAEDTQSTVSLMVGNTGFQIASNWSGTSSIFWNFGRAPSFMDTVCFTGTGVARTVTHNLQAVPELMIIRRRTPTGGDWYVYSATVGATKYLRLNQDGVPSTTSIVFNDTAPTSSVFTVGTYSEVNGSGSNIVAYLFATCAGVSKVGSYTGTGTTLQIDCGFTAGARFVLIKRTDSTGDWYVWDSARGIVSGNDSYLLLNSTAAEVTNTDYIDTYSAGFEISSTAPAAINANGGTYIFLAIA